jgi:thermitase
MPRRRSRLVCESLEDRRMLSAAYAANEILVQFAANATAAQMTNARAAVSGRAVEAIETARMQAAGDGRLERIAIPARLGVERAIAAIAQRPGVVFAEPNWRITTSAVSNDPFYTTSSRLWGMYGDDQPTATGPSGTTNQFGSQAEKAWAAGFTGSNTVYVGVLDEGIDINHPDLRANIWVNPFETVGDGIDNDRNGYVDDVHGWDFYSRDNSVYDGGTGDRHGTHVAGTIGGVGGNGIGVAGVSWNVTMIPLKFLGPDGGYTSDAIKALDYLTDLKVRHGLNIVASNNSWGGGGGYSSALHSAIIRGANAGILFVAAAGNAGVNTDVSANYPSNYSTLQGTSTTRAASYEAVISVAALTSSGGLASFSNYGATTVDIAAPGVSINSTLPGSSYGAFSGTSMAAPHVTGAIALYASAYPSASAAEIRQAILSSARPTASLAGKTVTGGRLDVAAALNIVPAVDIAITGGSVKEGDSGTTPLVFTVTLSAAATSEVTVAYATADGSALAGSDLAGSDYVARSGILSFAPGETVRTITIDVLGDTLVEPDETFTVVLSNASTNARITTGSATGTILNDDQAPAPVTPELRIDSVTGLENAGWFQFTITLSQASGSRVTVRFATANGSAKAGRTGDYVATSGTLTFNAGETTKTIRVQILDDTRVEPDEQFFVNLSRASGATIAVGRGIGTIIDDDALALTARHAAFATLAAATTPGPMGPAKSKR